MRYKFIVASVLLLGATLTGCGQKSGADQCTAISAETDGTCYANYNPDEFKHLVKTQEPEEAIYVLPKQVEKKIGDTVTSDFQTNADKELTPEGYALTHVSYAGFEDDDMGGTYEFVVVYFEKSKS